MNRQELFNMAYVGLAKQGFKRSFSAKREICMYRSGALRCAVGHCIPDDKYRPSFEGKAIEDKQAIRLAAGIAEDDAEWASRLQYCHDTGQEPDTMRSRLEAFAVEHNLSIPELPDEQGWDSQHMEQVGEV